MLTSDSSSSLFSCEFNGRSLFVVIVHLFVSCLCVYVSTSCMLLSIHTCCCKLLHLCCLQLPCVLVFRSLGACCMIVVHLSCCSNPPFLFVCHVTSLSSSTLILSMLAMESMILYMSGHYENRLNFNELYSRFKIIPSSIDPWQLSFRPLRTVSVSLWLS